MILATGIYWIARRAPLSGGFCLQDDAEISLSLTKGNYGFFNMYNNDPAVTEKTYWEAGIDYLQENI